MALKYSLKVSNSKPHKSHKVLGTKELTPKIRLNLRIRMDQFIVCYIVYGTSVYVFKVYMTKII